MIFRILKDGVIVNTIDSDEAFAREYAESLGGTYEEEHRDDPEPERSRQDDTDEMLIDHEYRLTMLELGV